MTTGATGFGALLSAALAVYLAAAAYLIRIGDSFTADERPLVLGLRVLAGACALAALLFTIAFLNARAVGRARTGPVRD
jgi:hypothetical protein